MRRTVVWWLCLMVVVGVLGSPAMSQPQPSCPANVSEADAIVELNRRQQRNDWAAVKAWTECLLKTFPGQPYFEYYARHYYWWAVAWGDKQYAEAYTKLLEVVVPLQPRWFAAYQSAGSIALFLANTDRQWLGKAFPPLLRARELLELAVKAGDGNVCTPAQTERICYVGGNLTALELLPPLGGSYYLLGEAYRQSGRCEEAASLYRLAVATGKNWGSTQAAEALTKLATQCAPRP